MADFQGALVIWVQVITALDALRREKAPAYFPLPMGFGQAWVEKK
ncbi:hypothetical protein [Cohaesibacter celericrescens]|nr:hypothetical protein [Cohaesibacter celericrescens]